MFPLIDGHETQFDECLDGFSLLPASFWALWMSDFGLDGPEFDCIHPGGPVEDGSGDQETGFEFSD